jgi:hypothetical protein
VILHANDDSDVMKAADLNGFILMQRELDTGQRAWTWLSPRDEPQPQFLTRREAIAFMNDNLGMLPLVRTARGA